MVSFLKAEARRRLETDRPIPAAPSHDVLHALHLLFHSILEQELPPLLLFLVVGAVEAEVRLIVVRVVLELAGAWRVDGLVDWLDMLVS